MTVQLSMLGGAAAQFFDNNGSILSGGKLYTYTAGTTTPQTTYTSNTGSTAHTNPIILDSAGRVPGGEIWLTDGSAYKFILKTSADVIIASYDNVDGNASGVYNAIFARLDDPDGATLVAYTPAGTGAITTDVQTKLRETVSVKDFGAVGDGVTDDTAAIQMALDSGATQVTFPHGTYLITSSLNVTTTGQNIIGQGTTINCSVQGENGFIIGFNGVTFVKTDDILIDGITFIGNDNGLGSTYSYAIGVYPPLTNPYAPGNGCSYIQVSNVKASGFIHGIVATGADHIKVNGCNFSGMKYHASLFAGGYGVLFQTCYDVEIYSNSFLAQNGDRHAIYISADPSRIFDTNNVCKRVIISNNNIDWTNVYAISGFESGIMLRGSFDTTITGNNVLGAYGCIDYEIENAPGEFLTITGNNFYCVAPSTHIRSAVNILRTSGTYVASSISIVGNTVACSGDYACGFTISHSQWVNVSCNNIVVPNSISSFGIYFSNVTSGIIGGNNIYMGNGYGAIVFDSANDKITINKNEISGSNYFKFRYFTVPTNLTWGYARTFYATSDGIGGIITGNGIDDVVFSATSDANGILINVLDGVNYGALNMTFSSAASSIGAIYYRSSGSNTVTVGVTNHSGLPLPAATNAYSIVGTILN